MQTIEVTYDSGETVKIKPVPWAKLDDLSELLKQALKQFFMDGSLPGRAIAPNNRAMWAEIEKIVELLPLVGGGKLDVKQIPEVDRIISLFLTTTDHRDDDGAIVVPESERNVGLKPSEIAKLNGIDFFDVRLQARDLALEWMRSIQEKAKAEAAALEESEPEEPAKHRGRRQKNQAA